MFYRKILLTMVRSQSYLYSSLIKPKVSFQDDCVRPVGTSPTVLMMKKWPKNQLHWIRISAHGTQHDPKTRELELKTAILKWVRFPALYASHLTGNSRYLRSFWLAVVMISLWFYNTHRKALYYTPWLVQKTNAILYTNQIENQTNRGLVTRVLRASGVVKISYVWIHNCTPSTLQRGERNCKR